LTRYVAFLRAINVGGHVVKMDRLKALFEGVPFANVSTFIASGNVIFDATGPPGQIEATIETTLNAALGYAVATMVRSTAEIAGVVRRVEAQKLDPGGDVTLYVGFLKTAPTARVARATAAMSNEVDVLVVHGRELYWQCNKSFRESTVAGPRLEKAVAGPATFRNINTVRRLAGRTCIQGGFTSALNAPQRKYGDNS